MSTAKLLKPFKSKNQMRTAARLDIRPSDGMKASFSGASGYSIPAKIYDVSLTGAGLAIDKSFSQEIKIGQSISLSFQVPHQHGLNIIAKIKWVADKAVGSIKFGIEFDGSGLRAKPLDSSSALVIPDFAPIVGAVYKPYLFYERSPIKIETISKDIWNVRIFDHELLALPGIRYEAFLNSTTGTRAPILLAVTGVIEISTDSVLLAMNPVTVPKEISEWLAQQLVFGSNITPEKLRSLGFNIRNLANGLKFRYIKTQEEYEEVLQLRFRAYSLAGKVLSNKTAFDMVAPLDSISRVIGVYHAGKIVGSVAVSFPPDDEVILDTEKPFANGYPKPMPPKTEMIEVARLCTDPEYRRGDLMVRILEHIYKALQCGNRKIVITSTDDKLWPLYKSIGFKKTGMSYDHPYLAGIKHHVITQSTDQADLAKQINPLAWNYAWRDMSGFLTENGTIKRGLSTKVKIRMLEWLGRLLKINLKSKY